MRRVVSAHEDTDIESGLINIDSTAIVNDDSKSVPILRIVDNINDNKHDKPHRYEKFNKLLTITMFVMLW